ncbi:protein phosphatase CheZ [Pantoea ananatis]|uniref:protein phosphatase CheZ n=1 Tax=Pantoea ananas TaxID=553 RepID=UPI000CF3E309|nr:protein phosphatase CheZ [Pantoea ananatis]PQK93417.1 hypothetical protein CG433_11975 [Pantoea ananatis]
MKNSNVNVYDLIDRISLVLKHLRNEIKDVSLENDIKAIINAMPNAKCGLNDVLKMTTLSANKALTGAELASNQQSLLNEQASSLDEHWAHFSFSSILDKEDNGLKQKTVNWLGSVPSVISFTKGQLQDIMMAQEYLDLAGQVINSMSTTLLDVEKKLRDLLTDQEAVNVKYEEKNTKKTEEFKNQHDIDSLLDSLGI